MDMNVVSQNPDAKKIPGKRLREKDRGKMKVKKEKAHLKDTPSKLRSRFLLITCFFYWHP